MKPLSKLPKELKMFLFIVATRKLILGIPLKELKKIYYYHQNSKAETFFKELLRKINTNTPVESSEIEYLIDIQNKKDQNYSF